MAASGHDVGDAYALPALDASRVVAHVDLDAFYAQVETRRLGLGPDVPLVVQQWTGVIAVSYAARALNCSRFDKAAECRAKGARLQHVPVLDHRGNEIDPPEGAVPNRDTHKVVLDRYRDAGENVAEIFARTCHVEKASIDECYLDLTDAAEALLEAPHADERLRATAAETHCADGELDLCGALDRRLVAGAAIVAELRAAVLAELGYTASAGIAVNKQLAKLASAKNKPNKQTVVTLRAVRAMMAAMPIHDIRGLGPRSKGLVAVKALGEKMETAADLQRFSVADLVARGFEAKQAAWLYSACRGIDTAPVVGNTKLKSLNAFKSFGGTDLQGVKGWLRTLSIELVSRMEADREKNLRRAQTLVLTYRGPDSSALPRSKRQRMPGGGATPTAEAIAEAAVKLFVSVEQRDALPCTRIAIGATDFADLPPDGGGIARFFGSPSVPPGAADGAERPEARPAVVALPWCAKCKRHLGEGEHEAEHADWHMASELGRDESAAAAVSDRLRQAGAYASEHKKRKRAATKGQTNTLELAWKR